MGQKVNPNIFRLGVNKKWKTEFFEKKKHELPLYTFKSLEIKSYVQRFLEVQGIVLHDYKQHYSDSTLNLYISYFVLPEFVVNKKSRIGSLTLVNDGSKKLVQKYQSSTRNIANSVSDNVSISANSPINSYRIKKYLQAHPKFANLTNKSQHIVKDNSAADAALTSLKIEGVLNNLFKVLGGFTNNRFNIIVNFCCLNRNLSFLKKTQKKNFILLQKFKRTPFLKEGIELLFYTVYSRNLASLLAKFIAIQMKKIKRHKFFLSFLKQTLTVLMSSKFSKIKGAKIVVKGRLNGVPRAKHKAIVIGDVPVQSINTVIDYAQTTTHNSNGSYGIKVWLVEKD